MSTRRLVPLLALLLSAACGQQVPAHGCQADAQCPSGARCTAGVCAAGTRPTASVAPVGSVEEYALVRLDGTASSDPEGDVSEHRWTFRSVDAPCAPPEVAGRDAVALVRFGCAGRFEVSLTVTDALGLESDPLRTEVVVQPSGGAPIVLAGADVATDHRCGGSPLRCRPTDPLRLAAAAAEGVALRWSVLPPAGRPLDAARRVTFSPSPFDRSPTVEIVTDGTAISGDWIFRVEAVDAYGVVGAAHTRVSVRNRPPVVTFTPAGPFEHAFDAAHAVFTAAGAVAWDVADPDGDPIDELTGTWRHVGDGDGSLFDGAFDGTSVSFAVEVPYATPADALGLRGGEGLVRQIELYALDVNRTVGTATIPIEIGNRPPLPAGGAFDTSVPHRFDPVRKAYVATARAGTFVDPDGDPLVDSSGGPAPCGAIRMNGGEATVECAVPYEGVPALDRLAGVRAIPVAVRDPWEVATAVPVRIVTIQNSAPVLAGTPSPATRCVAFASTFGLPPPTGAPLAFRVKPTVTDPDGDPVLVEALPVAGGSANPSAALCTSPECVPFDFLEPLYFHLSPDVVGPIDPATTWLAASDGTARTLFAVSPTWQTASSCP